MPTPLTLHWVGADDLDRVALARFRSYAPAARELDKMQEQLLADRRAGPGDYLLAHRDGVDVGTTTALSMTMWLRGRPFPCQGVAFVGTIKTERRKSPSGGIASALMHETLRMARQRKQVLSALMPFRASFYEHFGYGLVERRCDWTVPLSLLPPGDFSGIRFFEPSDLPELMACRQRMVQQGQCNPERTSAGWDLMLAKAQNGLPFVDRPAKDGPVRGWLYLHQVHRDGKDILQVGDQVYDSHEVFFRQLHFLASLKDQYLAAELPLPADFPLHRLLRESQLPHRPVNHPTAHVRYYTRMQVRVLDHLALLNGMAVSTEYNGMATVRVNECEGTVSRLRLEMANGRITASNTDAAPDAEIADTTWASLVCGDLPADTAASLGLLKVSNPSALSLLSAFSRGPLPFSTEYF